MKKKNLILILLALSVLGVLSWSIYQYIRLPKTGYVDITELYNGFEMKTEMQQKYSKTKKGRDRILDSLALEVNVLQKKIESEKKADTTLVKQFESKRQEFFQREKSYNESNKAMSKQYDQEILTQLNQYVKNYGEEHGYTYIYGNDGNGSLMYARETKDVTKAVLQYINEKYQGVR